MAFTISLATASDLPAFTKAQFSAFVNNPLHDIVYPGGCPVPPASALDAVVSRHAQALTEATNDPTGPAKVEFVKAVDDATGVVAGGAKWMFYARDAERPEKIGVDWIQEQEGIGGDGEGSEYKRYAQKIMDEFHGRRVERMGGSHACESCLLPC